MKLIALFLSFLVCTLTITPCCAIAVRESQTKQAAPAEHACDDNRNDCCKECSPFYVCGTCIGFVIQKQPLPTFVLKLKSVRHNTLYIPAKALSIAIPIWQPPKIV